MTMKAVFIFGSIFALTVAANTGHAETFQWKDSNGQTVVSDVPPPSSAKGRRSLGGVKPSVVSEPVADKSAEAPKTGDAPKGAEPPKTMAEKEFEFKKRQQEAKEKADKQAKDEATQTEKRENCERARRNLTTLESNQPVTLYDDKGQRKYMETAQRDREMERARNFIAESCK